jgi:hypothetical protein
MSDASTEILLRCYLTVRVVGEQMDDDELAAALGPFGAARKLEREVARRLALDAGRCDTLGWAPDGNRQAFIDELLSVDMVEEVTR